ncbi:MAG: hypothetical protein M1822_010197 [Bathelium mastoideum]|nr:MAG: hypothetical protein M1822_010197 [Bathelium mastoideum]
MNCEIHLHDQRAEPASRKALLIFFVTGNPGLIEYYRTFLTHVYGILSKASIDSRDAGLADFDLHVNGRNLAGYGISSSYINFDENAALKRRLPLGLKDQIEYVEDSLEDTVRKIKAQRLLDKVHVKAEPNDGGKIPRDESKFPSRPVKVVLAGHSLGTYINLELLRRYKERTRLRQSRPANHTGRNHTTPPGAQDDPISEETKRRLMMQEDNGDDFELIGVTNICPTVTDLADSPSGRAVTAYGVSRYPTPRHTNCNILVHKPAL